MALGFALLATGAWLVMLFALAQVIDLFTGWHAAMARVRASDYSEAQQWEDRWLPRMATSRGVDWDDGEDERMINETIVYTTLEGHEHVAQVRRQVMAGWQPDSAYTVWYKDADPDCVTMRGPFTWIAVMIACGAVMAVALHQVVAHGGMPAVFAAAGLG